MLDRVSRALTLVRDPSRHRLIQGCTSALAEVERDDTIWHTEADRAIAETLLDRAG